MSRKYYYGTPDQEYYDETDYENAAQCIAESSYFEESDNYFVMVEMVNSRKSGHIFCTCHNKFREYGQAPCGGIWCDEYEPRNKKNGICKYHSYGLIETGRKWKVFADGTIKKISGRNKYEEKKTK